MGFFYICKSMRTLIIFASLLFLNTTQAQTSVWKATKDGKTIYFASDFGNMEPSYYPLPNEYYLAYNQADILILEDDSYNFTNAEILEMRQLPENKTLKTELTEAQYQQILKLCEDLEIEINTIENYKPLYAISYIKNSMSKNKAYRANSIDRYFRLRSDKAKKESIALLSYKNKADFYETQADSVLQNEIITSLANINEITKSDKKYYKDWKAGKTKSVEEYILNMKTDEPEYYKFLIIDKSEVLYQNLKPYFEKKKISFVLLSRLNLLGSDGIFEKMKSDGFVIEQL